MFHFKTKHYAMILIFVFQTSRNNHQIKNSVIHIFKNKKQLLTPDNTQQLQHLHQTITLSNLKKERRSNSKTPISADKERDQCLHITQTLQI
jgi:hypothetical protein